ncbi:MAG: BlaI/MecI/CopY family transcriptional regulator [Planctomycetota bacterium]|jgi:BlaI family penicillinase repressor
MAKIPNISDAEWQVMQVAWDRSQVTASEVIEELASRNDWSPRTVKTMLGRLVKKGALGFEAHGNRYVYHPKVSRQECLADASRSFLDRVFSGDPASLLLHYVRNVDLSPDEAERLRRILEERDAQGEE